MVDGLNFWRDTRREHAVVGEPGVARGVKERGQSALILDW